MRLTVRIIPVTTGVLTRDMKIENVLDELHASLYIGGILAAGWAIFGLAVTLHYRFMPVGRLKESHEGL